MESEKTTVTSMRPYPDIFSEGFKITDEINIFIRIDRNYLFGSFEITSIRLYTPLRNPLRGLHGVYNLIEVISS
jgi:hypothetical protein